MRKFMFFFVLMMFICLSGAASALPGYNDQINLIADNADNWKQDVPSGVWGYSVTDLDQNGRLEIIAASVQGTGFYTYLDIYEVNEEGTGLTKIVDSDDYDTDSAPDNVLYDHTIL